MTGSVSHPSITLSAPRSSVTPPVIHNALELETDVPDTSAVLQVDEDIQIKTSCFDSQEVSMIVEDLNSQGVLIEEADAELLLPTAADLENIPMDIFSTPPEMTCPPVTDEEAHVTEGNLCPGGPNTDEIVAAEDSPSKLMPATGEKILPDKEENIELENWVKPAPTAKENETVREEDPPTRRRQCSSTLTTYNEDELSQRIMSSQGDTDPLIANSFMIMKTNSILKDIAEQKFTTKCEKPKGKRVQLNNEEPTHGIFKRKCGFTTTRPLKWAEALETWLDQNSFEFRWDYLCDNDDKILECNVKIAQQPTNSKKVVVELSIISGVVMISGTGHQDWINDSFTSWSDLVECGNSTRLQTTTQSGHPSSSTVKQDEQIELSQLWEENTKMKTSLSTLESAINDLRSDLQTMTERMADHHSSNEALIQTKNKEWDGRLQGFLLAAEETSQFLVQQCKSDLSEELANHRSTISNQQSWVQSNIETLKKATPVNTSVESEEQPPKWSDLASVANSCKAASNSTSEEIHVIKEDIDALKSSIATLASTHSEEQLPKWCDLENVANGCKLANKTTSEELTSLKESIRTAMLQPAPQTASEHHPGTKKLVLLTDSNGKRLDKMKFCRPIPLKDVTWEICYTLADITAALESLRDIEMDMIVICCGTNDIDQLPGSVVAEKLTQIVHRIKLEHPMTKIVLSETTPRKFTRDDEIKHCNQALHEQLDLTPNVFIADQSKLRDATWSLYEDNKHILRDRINVYAGNIKAAMRKARTNTPNKSSSAPDQHPRTSMHAGNSRNNRSYLTTHTTSNTRDKTSTSSNMSSYNIQPLMSCSVAPPPQQQLGSNSVSSGFQAPGHPGSGHPRSQPSFSLTPRMSCPPPMRGTTPIGDRLINISQNQHQTTETKENKLRDTLVAKLSEVLMCLQAW